MGILGRASADEGQELNVPLERASGDHSHSR